MFLLIFNNMYYVYIHRKATTGEVFYVGKGHGNRAYSHRNRNRMWQRVVKRHGITVEIVIEGIQEWYAFELEKDLITSYGRRSDNSGVLVNMTEGGEGVSGFRHSEETKTTISKKNKGTKKSADFCKKLSVLKIGNTNMLGKTLSTESRIKIAEANRNRHVSNETKHKIGQSNSKAVLRSDGVVYASMVEAGRLTGIYPSSISSCCSGKVKSAGGYYWSYVNG